MKKIPGPKTRRNKPIENGGFAVELKISETNLAGLQQLAGKDAAPVILPQLAQMAFDEQLGWMLGTHRLETMSDLEIERVARMYRLLKPGEAPDFNFLFQKLNIPYSRAMLIFDALQTIRNNSVHGDGEPSGIQQNENGLSRSSGSQTPAPPKEMVSAGMIEKTDYQALNLAPPITQTMTTYVFGDDLYDESFSIDSSRGEFLGEYGVGVSETIGVGEPKKVTALEVWLFDKNDIKTCTRVLMSEHAYNDPELRARLEAKGDLVVVKPGEQVLLAAHTLQLLATVVDMEFGAGAGSMPVNSYFNRITLELAIWPRRDESGQSVSKSPKKLETSAGEPGGRVDLPGANHQGRGTRRGTSKKATALKPPAVKRASKKTKQTLPPESRKSLHAAEPHKKTVESRPRREGPPDFVFVRAYLKRAFTNMFSAIRKPLRLGSPPKQPPAFMKAAALTATIEKTDFEKLGISPPITQVFATYVFGDDLYDESFSIDTKDGEFLGEYGVGMSETIGAGGPKKVAALEVWLFDKNDIKTGTKVLISEHASNNPDIRTRLESKGDLVVVKPGEQMLLEAQTLQLLATVVDMEYGSESGTLPPNSYFERITLELAVWPHWKPDQQGNEQPKNLESHGSVSTAAPLIPPTDRADRSPKPGVTKKEKRTPPSVLRSTTKKHSLPTKGQLARPEGGLPMRIGNASSGEAITADLTRLPHLLIAGRAGSGIEHCLPAMIGQLMFDLSPEHLRLVLIDSDRRNLIRFSGVPHLYGEVAANASQGLAMLKVMIDEMDRRYHLLANRGARNLQDYQKRRKAQDESLPYVLVVIDELAELMTASPDQTERTIVRLAQMARATGIHLIVATQQPSVDVVTGLIKANFPRRLAFAVATQMESRLILDRSGAEELSGNGDLLFLAPDTGIPVRAQGIQLSEGEIDRILARWKKTSGDPSKSSKKPEKLAGDSGDRDELLDQAVSIVRQEKGASVSLLQRRLRIGYTRAKKLFDQSVELGIPEMAHVGHQKQGSSETAVKSQRAKSSPVLEYEVWFSGADPFFFKSFPIQVGDSLLGECGVSVCQTIREKGAVRVTALEVWLTNLASQGGILQIIATEAAWNHPARKAELQKKGKVASIEQENEWTLELGTIRLRISIADINFLASDEYPHAYLDSASLDLRVDIARDKRVPRPSTTTLPYIQVEQNLELASSQDPLLDDAISLVRKEGRASVSMLQRRMRLGYTRAARLVDVMEDRKIIGTPEGELQMRPVLDFGQTTPPGNDGL